MYAWLMSRPRVPKEVASQQSPRRRGSPQDGTVAAIAPSDTDGISDPGHRHWDIGVCDVGPSPSSPTKLFPRALHSTGREDGTSTAS